VKAGLDDSFYGHVNFQPTVLGSFANDADKSGLLQSERMCNTPTAFFIKDQLG